MDKEHEWIIHHKDKQLVHMKKLHLTNKQINANLNNIKRLGFIYQYVKGEKGK